MKYINISLVLLFSLFIHNTVKAQLDFREGYIIELNNDTIYGFVDNSAGYKRNAQYCIFKVNENSPHKTYMPYNIKAYRIIDDKFYVSKPIRKGEDSVRVFLEFLVDGITNLYYYRNEQLGEHYFIEKENEYFIELTDVEKEVVIDGHKYIKNSNEYVGILKYTFRDCPEIQLQANNTELKHNSLIKLTTDYHEYTCKDEKCIVYKKKPLKSDLTLGIFSGIQFSKYTFYEWLGESDPIYTVPLGILFNATLPVINEKLSLQLELSYNSYSDFSGDFVNTYSPPTSASKIKVDNSSLINLKTLSIPLILKYNFTGKEIIPSIGIGRINAFNLSGEVVSNIVSSYEETTYYFKPELYRFGWLLDFGLDYNFNENYTYFSNIRLQLENNYFIEDDWLPSYDLYEFKIFLAIFSFGVKF